MGGDERGAELERRQPGEHMPRRLLLCHSAWQAAVYPFPALPPACLCTCPQLSLVASEGRLLLRCFVVRTPLLHQLAG